MIVYHRALESKLGHSAFQLVCRRRDVLHRQVA
jgi:hypothetical protein